MEKNNELERILLIMKHYKMKQRPFAMKIGMSPQTLNTMIINNGKPSLSLIQDILRAFPEISIEWLVMGEGDMVKPKKEDDNWKVTEFIPIQNNELVELQKKHITTLEKMNAMLEDRIKTLEGEKKAVDVGRGQYSYVAAEE